MQDLRINSKKSRGLALTPLSRRFSPHSPSLFFFNALIYNACVRAKALRTPGRFLLRFPRACTRDIMDRTCARTHTHIHTRGTVNIYEAFRGGLGRGWENEKSPANPREALCGSTKSRVHRECVKRLPETSRPLAREGDDVSRLQARECCYFRER